VYGIINYQEELEVQNIKGISENNTYLKPYKNLATVVSDYPEDEDEPVLSSRQNLLTHQKVIEYIFEKQTILPSKFGTLMSQNDFEIFFQNNYAQLEKLLNEFQGKAEMILKGFWKDMPSVFSDIAQNSKKINDYKQKIQNGEIASSQSNLIEIGKMVEDELLLKKEKLHSYFQGKLDEFCLNIVPNEIGNEAMFLNIACLIDKKNEKEFDECVQKLTDEFDKEAKFQYFGPAAAANFIKIETI
jgi:hypothetical protein